MKITGERCPLQTSPRAHLYEFEEDQESVRLVVASDDDTCAIISVQNNSVSEHRRRVVKCLLLVLLELSSIALRRQRVSVPGG